MIRKILAVAAGNIVAFIIIMIVEGISSAIYPLPKDLDLTNREAAAAFIANLPAGAYAMVFLAWILGSFAGGFTAAKVSQEQAVRLPMVVGIILTVAAVLNFVMLPHPAWMVVVGLLVFIPFALLGHRIARKPV